MIRFRCIRCIRLAPSISAFKSAVKISILSSFQYPLVLGLIVVSESESALLSGMFAHTRNLFWRQKLHGATE